MMNRTFLEICCKCLENAKEWLIRTFANNTDFSVEKTTDESMSKEKISSPSFISKFFSSPFLRWLNENFEDEIREENPVETEEETAQDIEMKCSLKKKLTEDILQGNTDFLTKMVNQYTRTKNTARLLFLFRGNLELSHWLVDSASSELLMKLPAELWELVEKQLEDEAQSSQT